MRKDNISFEDRIKRQQELAGIKPLNENVNKGNLNTLIYSEKIKDVNYAIIKEHGSYYIKSTKKDSINESTDYDYIGGLVNKLEYKYPSYSDALKNLNMMKISINESLNANCKECEDEVIEERLQQDIENNQQPPIGPGESPMPSPAPQAAPQQQAPAPMPEPMPSELPPAPAPSPEAAPEGLPSAPQAQAPVDDDSDLETDNDDNDIDHYLGKLTYNISQTPEEELSEDKIKAIMNSIISALPLDRVSPEERLVLAKRVKRGGKKSGEEDAPSPETEQPKPEAPEPSPEPQPQEEPVQEAFLNYGKNPEESAEAVIKRLNILKNESDKKATMTDDRASKNYSLGYSHGMVHAIEAVEDYFDKPQEKPIQENKYPWNKCEKDQEKEYGSKKVADKVCGAIKAHNIKEDEKINEFYSKLDKTQLVFENSKLKYKNILIESQNNTVILSSEDKKFTFNVSEATVNKYNELISEIKVLSEAGIKLNKIIK